MINKYKFEDYTLLVYNLNGTVPKEGLNLTLIEENVDLLKQIEDQRLPIFSVNDIIIASLPNVKKKRTRDKVLEEEGIRSFYDLQCAYNLLRNHELHKSCRIRRFVEEKYSEIINLEWKPIIEEENENT